MRILAVLYYPASLIEALLNSVLPASVHPYTPFAFFFLLNIIFITVLFVWIIELVRKKRTPDQE